MTQPDPATQPGPAEPPEPRMGAWAALREVAGLLRLLLRPGRDDAEAVYDFLGSHNNLGRRTRYLNLGYWEHADDYDQACAALALLLAETAGLGPGQRVLDVGPGFGEQDRLWLERFAPDEILGVNVSARQVEVAQREAEAAGLGARLRYRRASALDTGLPDAEVDVVLALESAFHFSPRTTFFGEASRVLRPGGVLALADLAPRAGGAPPGLFGRALGVVGRRLWQVPEENMVAGPEYRRQLEDAGFVVEEFRSVAEHVFEPFKRYARSRQADPDLQARANPLLRLAWGMPTVERSGLDYLLIRARKPAP